MAQVLDVVEHVHKDDDVGSVRQNSLQQPDLVERVGASLAGVDDFPAPAGRGSELRPELLPEPILEAFDSRTEGVGVTDDEKAPRARLGAGRVRAVTKPIAVEADITAEPQRGGGRREALRCRRDKGLDAGGALACQQDGDHGPTRHRRVHVAGREPPEDQDAAGEREGQQGDPLD